MKKILTLLMTMLVSLKGGAFAMENADKSQGRAIFAGGCFWCMEAEFQDTKGVISVTSGYTGGTVPNPTYEQVAHEDTGHAEAIEVLYDPKQITYQQLLEIYWGNIDPTDAGGQFYDRGDSYRTAIFYLDEEQHKLAEASKQKVAEKLGKPIATEITAASTFYPAETYHQDYYQKNETHYKAYKKGSGREEKLKKLWQK